MKQQTNKQTIDFFLLWDKLINDLKSGKKRLPNGNLYRAGSIANYGYVKTKLLSFVTETGFELRLRKVKHLTQRELITERNYWKKFYRKFTNYLYNSCGHNDNYVGFNIKYLRSFFSYVKNDLLLDVGNFNRLLYVYKEEIPIITLTPQQLRFLIYDKEFEASLAPRVKMVKDIFVFGCTVALRFSDLMSLTKANLIKSDNNYYLSIRSKKTKVYSQVKLPDYAISIIEKHKKNNTLLPAISNLNLNKYIKILGEKAGWTEVIGKKREKRGKLKEKRKGTQAYRFCDHITTHTMRRTAITTMLTLGVPEHIVRSISGHTAGSKEFFRYVAIAQVYKDNELDKMHQRLKIPV